MNNIFKTLVFLSNSTAKILSTSFNVNKSKESKIIGVQTGVEEDMKKITGDWQRTGNDLRRSIVSYDRKLAK